MFRRAPVAHLLSTAGGVCSWRARLGGPSVHDPQAPSGQSFGAAARGRTAQAGLLRRFWTYATLAAHCYGRITSAMLVASAMLYSLLAPPNLPGTSIRSITTDSLCYQFCYLSALVGLMVGIARLRGGALVAMVAAGGLAKLEYDSVLYVYPFPFPPPPGCQHAFFLCGALLLLGAQSSANTRAAGGARFGRECASRRRRRPPQRFSRASLLLASSVWGLACGAASWAETSAQLIGVAAVGQLALPIVIGARGLSRKRSRAVLTCGGAGVVVFSLLAVAIDQYADLACRVRGEQAHELA